MTANEISQVSGGILEKEGLYPRKFGDVDYLVYVDGVLIGTTYGPPASASSEVGAEDPLILSQTVGYSGHLAFNR